MNIDTRISSWAKLYREAVKAQRIGNYIGFTKVATGGYILHTWESLV